MSTWAVLAAKQAAVASGLGVGVVPAIGSGSVDGFLIGALMSGACCAMMSGPARARLRAGRAGEPRLARRSAESLAGVPAFAGAPAGMPALVPAPAGARALAMAGLGSSQDEGRSRPAAEPDGRQAPAQEIPEAGQAESGDAGGYRSRHRLGDPSSSRSRPDSRRAAPRHAAPPVSFASRMSGLLSARTVLSGVRH